jgi:hypothetical protein
MNVFWNMETKNPENHFFPLKSKFSPRDQNFAHEKKELDPWSQEVKEA